MDLAAEVAALWDFNQPAVSEQRFRSELGDATGERALVLRTQLARSLGLQGRFDECESELDDVGRAVAAGDPAATALIRTYLPMEQGRRLRSSGQPQAAAPLFHEALAVATEAGLDHLAADAAHMLALVGTPEEQIEWSRRAMAIATNSADPRARRWVGSIANNLGWTLHGMEQYEAAQVEFERALAARREQGDPELIRIARWCVARGLRSLGRLDEALAIQTELRAEGPKDGYVEEELGELLLAHGRPAEAADHFAEAYELLAEDQSVDADRLSRLRMLGTPAQR